MSGGPTLRSGPGPVAVVLGLGQNGLGTVRALGRAGVPVIGIDSDLEQPSAQTRYARRVHCRDFGAAGPGLLECLLEIGRGLDERGVLYPSGDLNLTLISEQREALEPYFHVALPPKDVVRLFLNKKAFYRFAMEHGFSIPATYFPANPSEAAEVARQIAYPCLIKPFQPNETWRRTFDTRLFVASSADSLLNLYDHLFRVHEDLIVQEYMPGKDSELFWSATYLDAHGKPLAAWTGRKLRQYPRRFGSTTFAQSQWEPSLAQETAAILQAAGHRGLAFGEFKRDRRDGRFKLTEVTAGRTWFPHALVTASGINLPLIMYHDLLGRPTEVPATYVQGMKWIHEERDLKTTFLYFIPEGELSVWSWLWSYRGRRVYAYAAWDDPRPLMASLGRVARTLGRRVRRRLGGARTVAQREQQRHAGKKPKEMEALLLAADPTVGRSVRQVDFE